jgi:hypothetical protein
METIPLIREVSGAWAAELKDRGWRCGAGEDQSNVMLALPRAPNVLDARHDAEIKWW